MTRKSSKNNDILMLLYLWRNAEGQALRRATVDDIAAKSPSVPTAASARWRPCWRPLRPSGREIPTQDVPLRTASLRRGGQLMVILMVISNGNTLSRRGFVPRRQLTPRGPSMSVQHPSSQRAPELFNGAFRGDMEKYPSRIISVIINSYMFTSY
jgi:hypothetical protein